MPIGEALQEAASIDGTYHSFWGGLQVHIISRSYVLNVKSKQLMTIAVELMQQNKNDSISLWNSREEV